MVRAASSLAIPLLAAHVLLLVNGEIPNCPYQGPVFPKPTNLAASSAIQDVVANLTSIFEGYDSDPNNNPTGTSWSIQVFSSSDNDPIWEHYHTGQNLNSTAGVAEVDGDTIYRLGSLTKLYTILAFLIEAGDRYWNFPISQFIPQLVAGRQGTIDPIMSVDWSDITIGALASQMAGIVRDYAVLGQLTQENNQSTLIGQGFPPAPMSDVPDCGEYPLCTRQQLLQGISRMPPSWGPSQTPGYSNLGYQLLAYALEAITGKNIENMIETDIINKLGLNHTSYNKPADHLGAIPWGNNDGWAYSLGDASPTGNMYSSLNDLSSFGRAIFNNKLISAAQTRRWLKPAAYTSEFQEGVGYPWGTRRIPLGTGSDGHRVVDTYNKAGSINAYQAIIILLPDYEVGITAMLAGGWPGNANWDMADAIGPVLLPALEAEARQQADALYAGTYESAAANSSITLSTDPARPGLGIDRWVSNGTDMIPVAVRYTLDYDVTAPAIRLYPTGLESGTGATRRAAWKAVVENLDAPDQSASMFSTDCGSWVSQTTAVYADMPLDQFVFLFAADGSVAGIEPLALRATLNKAA